MGAWNGFYNQVETVGPNGRLLMEPCPECAHEPDVKWNCQTCDGDGEVPVYTDRDARGETK
jgi:hypothetical protein